MTVNGEPVTEEIEGRMLLVHFLRDQLGLTGTHWGCDTSNCGTCVVQMDGEPVEVLHRAGGDGERPRRPHGRGSGAGRQARPDPGGLRAVSRSAVRLLHSGHDDDRPGLARHAIPIPSDATIREAISGQICRCTGYTTIVRSVQWAAAKEAENRAAEASRPNAAATVGSEA